MKVSNCIALLCLLLHSVSPVDAASFTGLGDLPGGGFGSFAFGLSANGSVVVGQSTSSSGPEAFRWSAATGIAGLGDLAGGVFDSSASGVSADGSVVVGISESGSGTEAFRWSASEGMVGLGDLPGGDFRSSASDVSADGAVIVGSSDGTVINGSSTSTGTVSVRWTNSEGIVALGNLPGGFSSAALAVAADGTVLVGDGVSASNGFATEAYRSGPSGELIGLGNLDGVPLRNSQAFGVSADGLVIVGLSQTDSGGVFNAFRWTSTGGMVGLGPETFAALDTSSNGAVVVGDIDSGGAFIWNEADGTRDLRDVLVNDHGLDLTGWTLRGASGISDDGLTIVGYGINPAGQTEAWIANLAIVPEPSTVTLFALAICGLEVSLRRGCALQASH